LRQIPDLEGALQATAVGGGTHQRTYIVPCGTISVNVFNLINTYLLTSGLIVLL